MANERRQQQSTPSETTPSRRDEEIDREPGSNRGSKGQTRESRKVARDSEEDIQTMAGHDDSGKNDRSDT
jgi:chloramphenicol 3-O-phosphotransferase